MNRTFLRKILPSALMLAALVGSPNLHAGEPRMEGVNLSAAAFYGSGMPGTFGSDYYYPDATHFDYYKSRGVEMIRFPFRWERVQRTLFGALDATEMSRMDAVLDLAEARGMRVILDMHNYARCFVGGTEYLIGSPEVSRAAYQDAWQKLANYFKNRDCIWGYAIMNEPHDTGSYTWKDTAQYAINGIRAADFKHAIIVPGDGWSGAWSWAYYNSTLHTVTDPCNNLIFEAHQYFDNDSSGVYDASYDVEGAYATIGQDRLGPFVSWCSANGVRGIVGEIGVPDNDARWITVLDNALTYLATNNKSVAYWCGGPGWGTYPLRSEMRASQDEAPQMATLLSHGTGVYTKHWPAYTWYDEGVNPGASSSSSTYTFKSATASQSMNFFDHGFANYANYYGIYFGYTVPSGGYAGFGMQIDGGVNLSQNQAKGHMLSFWMKGSASTFVTVNFITTSDLSTATVSSASYATMNGTWQQVKIPLSAFVNANYNGAQRLKRIEVRGYPANGTAYVVGLDQFVIQKQESVGPTVTVNTSDGGSSYAASTSVTAAATASDASGIDRVEFLLDGERFATDSSSPYSAAFSMSTLGAHRLTAIAYDNYGNATLSTVKALTATGASANVHAGTWAAKGAVTSTATWSNFYQQPTGIPTSTTYTASFWLKGSGKVTARVLAPGWSTVIASQQFTATSTWTLCTLPAFSTGANTSLIMAFSDSGSSAGTFYLDDAFLGVAAGTNKLTNPGFESGNTGWSTDGFLNIVQYP